MCHTIPTVGKSWQRQGVLSFPSKIITTELDSEDTVTSSVRGLQPLLGLSHLQLGGSWKTAFISPEVASQWNSRIAFKTHASLSSLPSYYAVRAWQFSSVLGPGALHDVLLHGINLSSGLLGCQSSTLEFPTGAKSSSALCRLSMNYLFLEAMQTLQSNARWDSSGVNS